MGNDHYVDLRIPADPRMLRVARVAAASLAAELPFTLTDIEDLRIAVDELAAALLDGAEAGGELRLRLEVDGERLVVTGELPGSGPLAELHPVAQDLLAMVAQGHELAEEGGTRRFRFVKQVGALAP